MEEPTEHRHREPRSPRGIAVRHHRAAPDTRAGDQASDRLCTRSRPSARVWTCRTPRDDKRHLLIVPSGVLTGLPFHLLVTESPATPRPNGSQLQAYHDATWLIQRHAVTVLPSVSSLRALRVIAKGGQAAKPMIGFGDPVFGQPTVPAQPERAATQVAARSTTKTRAYRSYWRGTRADLEAIRAGLAPLPESAAELRAVARRLGAAESDLKLGPAASET